MTLWLLAILRCNVSTVPLWNQILCSQCISWKRTCGVQYRWGASRGIPHTYTPSPIPLSDLQPVQEDHGEVLRGSVIFLIIVMVKVMMVLRNSFFQSDVDGYAVTSVFQEIEVFTPTYWKGESQKRSHLIDQDMTCGLSVVTEVTDNIVITSELFNTYPWTL